MENLRLFNNFDYYYKWYEVSGTNVEHVVLCEDGEKLEYNKPDWSKEYLQVRVKTAGNGAKITLSDTNDIKKVIEYSKDYGETWTSVQVETGKTEYVISGITDGDVVVFRGNNDSYAENSKYFSIKFYISDFKTCGNIMSMIYGNDFIGKTEFPDGSTHNFYYLFSDSNIKGDLTDLILPATTLAPFCYVSMFAYCTSLEKAPVLPATTLANSCYGSMFEGCTSLTTAPELPATTLSNRCYSDMFNGCTSLITAPELPATTLAQYCYSGMFNGCSSLREVTCLATDITAQYCTYRWLYGVSPTGTFIKHPDMNEWSTGKSGIPNGWTVQDAIL